MFITVFRFQTFVQFPHIIMLRLIGQKGKIEVETDADVFLREIVLVDQHFADLVGGLGILRLVGVVVVQEKLPVAVLDDRPGVGLDLVHDAQDLGDLGAQRRLGAEDDVTVGVGGVVPVVDRLGIDADLAVKRSNSIGVFEDSSVDGFTFSEFGHDD